MKIGSFNTQDNSINSHGGVRSDGTSNALIVSNIIKDNKFDLLGTQELTINYVNAIKLQLNNYKFYGNYRYGIFSKKVPYNENNNIINNKKVIEEKTIYLPWIANNFSDLKKSIIKMSIMPRIATIIVFDNGNNNYICMINTHLDYQVPSIQIRQLEELKNIIKKYSNLYPTIITGDFNMEVGNEIFDIFTSNIKDFGISHVHIEGDTWHNDEGISKKLDYIFIPSVWDINDAGIIGSKGTSDHDLIYVDAKVKTK